MNAINSIIVITTWIMLNMVAIAPVNSLGPAGPGPPQIAHNLPPQDTGEQIDLNLSGYSHEMNHIQPLTRNKNNIENNNKAIADRLTVASEVVNVPNEKNNKNIMSNSCNNDGNRIQKYVHDGETVVAASTVKNNIDNGDKKSSLAVVLDVINDVFDTTTEPLVPGLVYKGK